MRAVHFVLWLTPTLILACSSVGNVVETDQRRAPDVVWADQGEAPLDLAVPDIRPEEEVFYFDIEAISEDIGPQCLPGEGCFLDPCTENGQCQSGWCVDHLGEGVCTIPCSDECPAGWSCQQVAGTAPDLVFVCVSDFANLCRPCANGADCKGVGGTEDVCVSYADQGSFCGGSCASDDDCPSGFSCLAAETTDGIETTQCLADAGVCPCTSKSVALALWTPCELSSDHGTCTGKRVCTAEGLSPCDAATPAPEDCNGLDDNCDGDVDEPTLIEGKFVELCDDGNPCTQDACLGEVGCSQDPLDEGECFDGDSCTVGDHCQAGECVGQPIVCDDSNPCTDDACDGLGGCATTPNNNPCDDQDPCTINDTCSEGQCVGFTVDCDCQTDLDCAAMEDGDLCNGTLVCDTSAFPYECVVDPNTVVTCASPPEGPDAICLKASCDPLSGQCSLIPDHGGLACEDGNPCTVGDVCTDGVCAPGVQTNCNDGNPCTDDSCDDQAGCIHTHNNAPCNDDSVCTVGDVCAFGACSSGLEQLLCDDDNLCTDDACDPAKGCIHEPNQLPCDDGNPCTSGEACSDGWCVGGQTTECDDQNPCTTDSCDAQGGCIFKLNTLPCDDGNVCTLNDQCHLGECISALVMACDDNNLCTDDSCDPNTGCKYTPNAVVCDDGNLCTIGDTCVDGACAPGGQTLDCDDGNHCTNDFCAPQSGCVNQAESPCCGNGEVEAGEQCDDGNLDDGDGCSSLCQLDTGCVVLGSDVRTLEQGPEQWQKGYCQTLCEDTQTTIPMGWHIATAAEVAFLTKHVQFGACAAYGICGSYWYGGDQLTSNCSSLHYTCTTGGCQAYTSHCYTQVMLIRDGKDGTCLQ